MEQLDIFDEQDDEFDSFEVLANFNEEVYEDLIGFDELPPDEYEDIDDIG
jgi:hypothetical protein